MYSKNILQKICREWRWLIDLLRRVFANGPGNLGYVIPKTLKMVLDTSLFNTKQYKVRIKGSGAI